jgi:hypothetical protein
MIIYEDPSRKVRAVQIFEVKPKIHSCGALLRQLKVQDFCLSRAYPDPMVRLLTVPIIKADDPLFPLLKRMIGNSRRIITWDGSELKWWQSAIPLKLEQDGQEQSSNDQQHDVGK